MKLIKAKQSGMDRDVYINADSICTFYSDTYEGKDKTKIYFSNGKCEIEGNHAKEIASFIRCGSNEKIYDLTEVHFHAE